MNTKIHELATLAINLAILTNTMYKKLIIIHSWHIFQQIWNYKSEIGLKWGVEVIKESFQKNILK